MTYEETPYYDNPSKVELDMKKGMEKILKKQEKEITALRATLRTKSSISTSAKPIPRQSVLLQVLEELRRDTY